jgi:hypothetical protein
MEGTSVSQEQLLAALKCNFNHEKFRDLQLDAIQATLSGKDSLLILPTGQNCPGVDDLAFVSPRWSASSTEQHDSSTQQVLFGRVAPQGSAKCSGAAADAEHPS